MENGNTKTGTIIKAISGFYYVSDFVYTYQCKARGNFRHSKISPIVGDRVKFNAVSEDNGIITEILPRKNLLTRPAVSNIDKIIIVSSYQNPAPDLFMIDRMTAIAAYNKITPVIVFNKSDTGDFSEYERIYKSAGFNTYVVSAHDERTLVDLRKEFENCICAMAGNSGVGKSSLINSLFKGFELKTSEVSYALGRGKHTTRHTELFSNGVGGYVADTPGFSSIDPSDNLYDFKQSLFECFTDFLPYANNCAFTSCTHTGEPGCAIISAVNDGLIEKTRYESYKALFDELKDVKRWQTKK